MRFGFFPPFHFAAEFHVTGHWQTALAESIHAGRERRVSRAKELTMNKPRNSAGQACHDWFGSEVNVF